MSAYVSNYSTVTLSGYRRYTEDEGILALQKKGRQASGRGLEGLGLSQLRMKPIFPQHLIGKCTIPIGP